MDRYSRHKRFSKFNKKKLPRKLLINMVERNSIFHNHVKGSLLKRHLYLEFFWSAFFRNRTENRDLLRIQPECLKIRALFLRSGCNLLTRRCCLALNSTLFSDGQIFLLSFTRGKSRRKFLWKEEYILSFLLTGNVTDLVETVKQRK